MKVFAAAATLGAASALQTVELKYMNYLASFNKKVDSASEFNTRLVQFTIADEFITESNAQGNNYTLGHNKFSDMPQAEYEKMLGGRRASEQEDDLPITLFDESANHQYIDWVAAGAVTPVKNQAQCGSCWAFSSTGALEGAHFIATGELLSFSEQQLVSCNTTNSGCHGGLQDKAFTYWETTKAETEQTYPYRSQTGLTPACKYDEASTTAVNTSSYDIVTYSNVGQMKAALALGPLAVDVAASRGPWQYYESGVLDSRLCGIYTDHAVLVTGWDHDSDSGLDYWMVKNSWASDWGQEGGYIKLAIVEGFGICGVQEYPYLVHSN